jgi:hypothetical protein
MVPAAPSATNRSPISLKAIPVKPQFPEAGWTDPTAVRTGLFKFISQMGQGGAPEPPVYKLRWLSPVSPSIGRGVVMSVVKVALVGNCRLSSSSDQAEDNPEPRTKIKTRELSHLVFIRCSLLLKTLIVLPRMDDKRELILQLVKPVKCFFREAY